MSENPNSDDLPDNDPTDELPVLSEAAMAAMDAEVPTLADAVTTETGEHTARLLTPRLPDRRRSTVPDAEKAPSTAALERDIAALSARWGGLEAHLDRNATAIATLSEQLAATQQALNNSNDAQRQLFDQLTERDAGLDDMRRSLDDSNVARQELLADLGRKDERIEQLQAALEQSTEEARAANEALARKERQDDAASNDFAHELAQSEAKLEEIEQARESAHSVLEAELVERDAALNEARTAAQAQQTHAASLAAKLARRDTTINGLRAEVAEQRQRLETLESATARAAELEEELQRERQAPRAARDAFEASDTDDIDEYRAEIASLTAYIENRRREWDDLHATLAEQKTRIAELARELGQRAERQMQLEATVLDETERSTALRTELAALKRQLANDAAVLARERFEEAQQEPPEATDAEALEARIATLEQALAEQRDTLDAQERELTAAAAARAELEEQLAAREQRLAALKEQLAAQEQSRAVGPELVDPDLPVEEQGQRLATLQRELGERIAALRELQDDMTSGEVVDFDARRSEEQAAAATGHRFSLVCLTSDEPQAYDVDRPAMVIGRSSDCDIQILTHFVSREHARLERDGGSVLIEDLGSTNGVFVNAVRIERQPLRHGDWVTIGETQFRFIDGRST